MFVCFHYTIIWLRMEIDGWAMDFVNVNHEGSVQFADKQWQTQLRIYHRCRYITYYAKFSKSKQQKLSIIHTFWSVYVFMQTSYTHILMGANMGFRMHNQRLYRPKVSQKDHYMPQYITPIIIIPCNWRPLSTLIFSWKD